jgi:hypothetical protein
MKCLLIFIVPSWNSNTPLYPWSATSQGACPNSFSFHCFRHWTCNWIHQRAWGCVSIFLTVRKASVESTNLECNKVDTMMCCIINKGVWNVCIGNIHWCETLKCTNFWQAFILMKSLQKYVQKQGYIVFSHKMNLCPKYTRKELLKMYLTITKFEAKDLTRLGEKHRKTLPNWLKHPKKQPMGMPPIRLVPPKEKEVYELNNDEDFFSYRTTNK